MSRTTKFANRPKFDKHDDARRKRLGELLARARRQVRLTQGAVALTLGYTYQNRVSKVETGKAILHATELENLARLYGKSLNDFATWRPDQPTTQELLARARSKRLKSEEVQRRYSKKQTFPST